MLKTQVAMWSLWHCQRDIFCTGCLTFMKPLFHTAAFRRVLPAVFSYGFGAIHGENERMLFNGGSPCTEVNVFRIQQ